MGGITGPGIRGALPEPLGDRFWRKVRWSDDDGAELAGCWEWTGFYNPLSRQPQMNTKSVDLEGLARKSSSMAYRVSWVLSYGPPPEGHMPYRACANRRSVRPDHLRLRTKRGPRTLFPGAVRRRVVKLTESDAAEIRRIVNSSRGRNGRADYGIYRRVAERFGVARQTVDDVMSGKTWPGAIGSYATGKTLKEARAEERTMDAAEHQERNARIYDSWKGGCQVSVLAVLNGVSRARISQIVAQERRRMQGGRT